MAWCLAAPSHSPTQCWLINITTQRHCRWVVPQQSITKITLKISFKFTRGPIQWVNECCGICHYSDVIMSSLTSQITSVSIVYSTVNSGADQRKLQSSASLAFVRAIHRWPWASNAVMFPFDDVIMWKTTMWTRKLQLKHKTMHHIRNRNTQETIINRHFANPLVWDRDKTLILNGYGLT